jgi:acylphosphatase
VPKNILCFLCVAIHQYISTMPTKHLLIKGKVQGVFYRASAKEAADGLGVTGWIRNTDNGDVEALVSGTEEQLTSFIAWCKQGPPAAVVRSVEVNDKEEKSFENFFIARR